MKKYIHWNLRHKRVNRKDVAINIKCEIYTYTAHFYNPEACSDSSQIFKLKTACYYHVTCVFHNERTLYSSLNAKEFLAQNRRDIWSLSDSNRIRTHSHLVRKLAKQDSLTKGLSGRFQTISGCGFKSCCCYSS